MRDHSYAVKVRFFLSLILFSPVAFAQQTELKLLGEYSWSKKQSFSAEKLNVRKTVRDARKTFEEKKTNKPFIKKINLRTETLPRNTIKEPKHLSLHFTSQPLKENEVMKASPFLFKDNSTFNVTYADKQHGFPTNSVLGIAEDAEKNIWIATGDIGLIKYDGINYHIYNQRSGLPFNGITDIAFDPSSGRIWLTSETGYAYIEKDSLFLPDSVLSAKEKTNVFRVVIEEGKGVWLCTINKGAIKFTNDYMQVYDTTSGFLSNFIANMFVDSHKNMWFSFWGKGVMKISDKECKMIYFGADNSQVYSVYSFCEDSSFIWLAGFDMGIVLISDKDTLAYSINGKFKERIYSFQKVPGGMWFSLYGGGVCYSGQGKCLKIDNTNGLAGRNSFQVKRDSYGNIWVSDPFAGISRINESPFYVDKNFPPILGSTVNRHTTKDGSKWYFTNGGSLWKEDEKGFYSFVNREKVYNDEVHHSFDGVINEDGSIWATTYGRGPCLMNEKTFTFYEYPPTAGENMLTSIAKDPEGRIWFGALSFGLVFQEKENFYHLSQNHGLLGNATATLGTDLKGNLCCGFQNGMQKINQNKISTFCLNGKPLTFSPSCFYTTADGLQLIGTSDQGLLVLDQNKIYALDRSNGLGSDIVNSVIEDKKNNIWVATSTGITRFSLNKHSISNLAQFTIADGTILGGLHGGAFLNDTGDPCWSSESGIICYDLAFESRSQKVPVMNFISARVNDSLSDLSSSISVLSSDNLEIQYNVICWGNENKMKLSYLLVSAKRTDTTSFLISEPGRLSIRDLNEGKYSLLLKAQLNGKNYFSAPLELMVHPFWYNTVAFRLGVLLCILLAVIYYFRRRTRLVEKRKQELEKIVAEKTAELITEKMQLEKQNQVIAKQNIQKDALIQEIHHRVKNNLQSISIIVEMQMKQEKGNKSISLPLREIYRRISAMALVHEMLYRQENLAGISSKKYFSELLESINEIVNTENVPVSFKLNLEDVFMNVSKSIALGMIASEAISNSIKHAFQGVNDPEIKIELSRADEKGNYVFLISDNGSGIGPPGMEAEKKLGTRLIDIFVRQVNGKYELVNAGGVTHRIEFAN